MATAKKTTKANSSKSKAAKKDLYIEPTSFMNPPKGYKKPTSNLPDPKKVREYYSKKK